LKSIHYHTLKHSLSFFSRETLIFLIIIQLTKGKFSILITKNDWLMQHLCPSMAKHRLFRWHSNHLDCASISGQCIWPTNLYFGIDDLFFFYYFFIFPSRFSCLALQIFKVTFWFVFSLNLVPFLFITICVIWNNLKKLNCCFNFIFLFFIGFDSHSFEYYFFLLWQII